MCTCYPALSNTDTPVLEGPCTPPPPLPGGRGLANLTPPRSQDFPHPFLREKPWGRGCN